MNQRAQIACDFAYGITIALPDPFHFPFKRLICVILYILEVIILFLVLRNVIMLWKKILSAAVQNGNTDSTEDFRAASKVSMNSYPQFHMYVSN